MDIMGEADMEKIFFSDDAGIIFYSFSDRVSGYVLAKKGNRTAKRDFPAGKRR